MNIEALKQALINEDLTAFGQLFSQLPEDEKRNCSTELQDVLLCALILAAAKGDTALVKVLLANPAVAEKADAQDNFALRVAAYYGREGIVKLLLGNSSVIALERQKSSCWEAVISGDEEQVEFDLARPAVKAALANDKIALYKAMMLSQGNAAIVKHFLLLPEVIQNATWARNAALHEAMRQARDPAASPEERQSYEAVLQQLIQVEVIYQYEKDHPGGEASLRELLHRENAMRALTENQLGIIKTLKKFYEKQFDERTQAGILVDFENYLKEQYQKNAAKSKSGDALPFDYHPTFTEEEHQSYYSHLHHTTWRWLFACPNPWIHPHAFYAERVEGGYAANISESHKTLIAYLWLAANDETVKLEKGWTTEKLREHFVSSLAQLARAHNWDREILDDEGTIIDVIELLADDQERDRPSCARGITQRLISGAILGHPYLLLPSARILDSATFHAKCWDVFFGPTYEKLLEGKEEKQLKQIEKIFQKIIENEFRTKEEASIFSDLIDEQGSQSCMASCRQWWEAFHLEQPCQWQGSPYKSYYDLLAEYGRDPAFHFIEPMSFILTSRLNNIHLNRCRTLQEATRDKDWKTFEALFLQLPDDKEIFSSVELKRALINISTVENNAILTLVSRYGYESVMAFLLRNPFIRENAAVNNNNALRIAAKYGQAKIIPHLLAVPAVSKDRSSLVHALELAAREGHSAAVSALLENAEIVRLAGEKLAPLWKAAENEHEEVVDILLAIPSVAKKILSQITQDGGESNLTEQATLFLLSRSAIKNARKSEEEPAEERGKLLYLLRDSFESNPQEKVALESKNMLIAFSRLSVGNNEELNSPQEEKQQAQAQAQKSKPEPKKCRSI